MRIGIELPRNRDRCGRLSLLDDRSRVIFGPVWCAGRAIDAVAAGYGNDGRSYFLPYGDTPPGGYKVKKLISMRGASPRAMMQFGRFGVISLAAVDGPAVIADSVGRFEIWIHGGRRDPDGRLRQTNGSLRLADDDLFRLINLLKGREGLRVDVREAPDTFDAPLVGRDDGFDEGDPPVLEHLRLAPSRFVPPAARVPMVETIFMGEYDGGGKQPADTVAVPPVAGTDDFNVKVSDSTPNVPVEPPQAPDPNLVQVHPDDPDFSAATRSAPETVIRADDPVIRAPTPLDRPSEGGEGGHGGHPPENPGAREIDEEQKRLQERPSFPEEEPEAP
jgi:hypothetical protein